MIVIQSLRFRHVHGYVYPSRYSDYQPYQQSPQRLNSRPKIKINHHNKVNHASRIEHPFLTQKYGTRTKQSPINVSPTQMFLDLLKDYDPRLRPFHPKVMRTAKKQAKTQLGGNPLLTQLRRPTQVKVSMFVNSFGAVAERTMDYSTLLTL